MKEDQRDSVLEIAGDVIRQANDLCEHMRIERIKALELIELDLEKDYLDFVLIAATACDTAAARLTVLDDKNLYVKAVFGREYPKIIPRASTYCDLCIKNNGEIVISDTMNDARIKDADYFTEKNIRFYAGFPLISSDGFAVGTICVADVKPRLLTNDQLNTLRALARIIMKRIERSKKS
jgi:GAF domain-containing protein